MAQVTPIGQPSNDPEREVIAFLRDGLPTDYRIVHNFELRADGGQWFEIDLAVVAPHAVYLIDIKSTYGEIHVAGGKWHPEGRSPFASPLAKLRQHTRQLHGVLSSAATPQSQGLRHVWCEALVILSNPTAILRDPEGRDRDNVVKLDQSIRRLSNPDLLPERTPAPSPTAPFIGRILETFSGKNARPMQGLPRLGLSWQCEERLTANDFYTEYRARNTTGFSSERVILRVYRADPYATRKEREAERERIANAYSALTKLPPHPFIPAARDFFPTEREDGYVLVLNDSPGTSLRLHIAKPEQQLTTDQKIQIADDLLVTLAHCHGHEVIHRAISPDTIVIGLNGHARLVDFDFARPGEPRDRTVSHELSESIDHVYLAPEIKDDTTKSSQASDIYAAGATLYEMFTGKRTFEGLDEAMGVSQVFPEKPQDIIAGLPDGFDNWLEKLCAFDPKDRPSAGNALEDFRRLFTPPSISADSSDNPPEKNEPLDYTNLVPGTELKGKYLVEGPLGNGGFGRVYKVIDTYCDMTRALKIVTKDRLSTLERMKQEYRTLAQLPTHTNVVKVFDGDCLEADGVPFLVMEYVEGALVLDLIKDRKLSLAEAVELGIQVAEGLDHCHRHQVGHGDIKPENLMWTGDGTVKIIDFNVSVKEGDDMARAGGTRHYLAPDADTSVVPTSEERFDRDIFALGVTLYEAITGQYPWDPEKIPPAGKAARDPREVSGCEDLSDGLVEILLKAIATTGSQRFTNASDFRSALKGLNGCLRIKRPQPQVSTTTEFDALAGGVIPPNTNPFVSYLLTLYSQSTLTNAGTRGLDHMGRQIYVETALDKELQPATLAGQFRLVLISGNAGDGKTAFIQQIEDEVRRGGVEVTPSQTGNGSLFTWNQRGFVTNYDGSQDEGEKINDNVLKEFFASFSGEDASAWADNETRIIAINEGRLIDFLEQFGTEFKHLKKLVSRGLMTGVPEEGVAIVNLNLRSVVSKSNGASIMARLLERLSAPQFWAACQTCDLKDKCFVRHNAQTFANPNAGRQVIERLELLYRLVTLRGKLHITMRDLRSAIAHMIAGTRDCAGIHELYASGERSQILQGYYFNSWAAIGNNAPKDRLLRLLSEIDVGQVSDPKLDRAFDFHPPTPAPILMDFDGRQSYDRELLLAEYRDLPVEFNLGTNRMRFQKHRSYVSMLRRRHFFESRDATWKQLIPYDSASRMLELLETRPDPKSAALPIIRAINQGEGLSGSSRLRGKLALQVRAVDAGTLRSYRVFEANNFSLIPQEPAQSSPYLEHAPTALLLCYHDETSGLDAELTINLDVFEMLDSLNQGYRPTVDELQGYYLSLTVFKNILGSAPYQEVLLTPNAKEFYSVIRDKNASLTISVAEDPAEYHVNPR